MRQYIVKGVLFAFLVNSLGPMPSYAQIQLPAPGVMIEPTSAYSPAIVKGLVIDLNNPLQMDFLIDPGQNFVGDGSPVPNKGGETPPLRNKKEQYQKLAQYFLASLTVPEKDLWVNLSPYEKNRIVPQEFGKTQMGRDLLAQDYILKQLTASLIYPEKQLGKEFWQKVYAQAQKQFGKTDIPVNTFNKVWIVPDKAVVYEKATAKNVTAFLVESHLKVMLEEDYLSMEKHNSPPPVGGVRGGQTSANEPLLNPPHKGEEINSIGSDIIRQIVLPAIEREVNEGKNFANLRQINNSLILATWYKKRLKESILGKLYVDQNKTTGIQYVGATPRGRPLQGQAQGPAPTDIELIYQQYLAAFKKGVYNYIKEEPDPTSGQLTPRKYFSGGYSTIVDNATLAEREQVVTVLPDSAMKVLSQSHLDRAQINLQNSTTDSKATLDVDFWSEMIDQKVFSKNWSLVNLETVLSYILGLPIYIPPGADDITGLEQFEPYASFLINKDGSKRKREDFPYQGDSLQNLERFTQLGMRLNAKWKEHGFEKYSGHLTQYIARIQRNFIDPNKFPVVQKRIDYLTRGSLEDQTIALWVRGIQNVFHLRRYGAHINSGEEQFYDNIEIKNVVRQLIPALLTMEAQHYPDLIPNQDYSGAPARFNYRDLMFWGLITMLDPSLNHYLVDKVVDPRRTKEVGDRLYGTPKAMMTKFLMDMLDLTNEEFQDAKGRQKKITNQDIDDLLTKVFSVTEEEWIKKGLKSPYDAFIRTASTAKPDVLTTVFQITPDRSKSFPMADTMFSYALGKEYFDPHSELFARYFSDQKPAHILGMASYIIFTEKPFKSQLPQLAAIFESRDPQGVFRKKFDTLVDQPRVDTAMTPAAVSTVRGGSTIEKNDEAMRSIVAASDLVAKGVELLSSATPSMMKENISKGLVRIEPAPYGIKFVQGGNWHFTATSLNEIDQLFELKKKIIELDRLRTDKSKPLVILDWGCGKGNALNDLKEFLAASNIQNVKLIGYSDQYYSEWKKSKEGITYIWDKAGNLNTYLGGIKADIIFSHYGLMNVSEFVRSDYVNSLMDTLNPGGQLIFNVYRTVHSFRKPINTTVEVLIGPQDGSRKDVFGVSDQAMKTLDLQEQSSKTRRYLSELIVLDQRETPQMKRLGLYQVSRIPESIKQVVKKNLMEWEKNPDVKYKYAMEHLLLEWDNPEQEYAKKVFLAIDDQGEVEGYFVLNGNYLTLLEIHPRNRSRQKFVGVGPELIAAAMARISQTSEDPIVLNSPSPDMKAVLNQMAQGIPYVEGRITAVFTHAQAKTLIDAQAARTDSFIQRYGMADQAMNNSETLEKAYKALEEILDYEEPILNRTVLGTSTGLGANAIRHMLLTPITILRNGFHPRQRIDKEDFQRLQFELKELRDILARFSDAEKPEDALQWADAILSKPENYKRRFNDWLVAQLVKDGGFTPTVAQHINQIKIYFETRQQVINAGMEEFAKKFGASENTDQDQAMFSEFAPFEFQKEEILKKLGEEFMQEWFVKEIEDRIGELIYAVQSYYLFQQGRYIPFHEPQSLALDQDTGEMIHALLQKNYFEGKAKVLLEGAGLFYKSVLLNLEKMDPDKQVLDQMPSVRAIAKNINKTDLKKVLEFLKVLLRNADEARYDALLSDHPNELRVPEGAGYPFKADITRFYVEVIKKALQEDVLVYLQDIISSLLSDEADQLAQKYQGQLKERYVNDFDHGPRHAEDLLKKAVYLAEAINMYDQVDWKVLGAAIALHDIFAYQDIDHGPKAMAFAKEFLKGKLSEAQIEKVVEAIRLHDVRDQFGKDGREKAGIESQILYDVDQLDAFGYKGIYRYLAVYFKRGEAWDSIKQKVPQNAKVRFESLTFSETTAMAQADYKILTDFFERLAAEPSGGGITWIAKFIQKHQNEDPRIFSQEAQRVLSGLSQNEKIIYAQNFFKQLAAAYDQAMFSVFAPSQEQIEDIINEIIKNLKVQNLEEDVVKIVSLIQVKLSLMGSYGSLLKIIRIQELESDIAATLELLLERNNYEDRRILEGAIIFHKMFYMDFESWNPHTAVTDEMISLFVKKWSKKIPKSELLKAASYLSTTVAILDDHEQKHALITERDELIGNPVFLKIYRAIAEGYRPRLEIMKRIVKAFPEDGDEAMGAKVLLLNKKYSLKDWWNSRRAEKLLSSWQKDLDIQDDPTAFRMTPKTWFSLNWTVLPFGLDPHRVHPPLMSLDRLTILGSKLNQMWKEKRGESIYPYLTLFIDRPVGSAEGKYDFYTYRDRVDALTKEATGIEKTLTLWARGVMQARHLRYVGMHAEVVYSQNEQLEFMDNEDLVKIVREFIPLMMQWKKDEKSWNTPLPVPSGYKGEPLGVTYGDLMEWGLIVMLNPYVHNTDTAHLEEFFFKNTKLLIQEKGWTSAEDAMKDFMTRMLKEVPGVTELELLQLITETLEHYQKKLIFRKLTPPLAISHERWSDQFEKLIQGKPLPVSDIYFVIYPPSNASFVQPSDFDSYIQIFGSDTFFNGRFKGVAEKVKKVIQDQAMLRDDPHVPLSVLEQNRWYWTTDDLRKWLSEYKEVEGLSEVVSTSAFEEKIKDILAVLNSEQRTVSQRIKALTLILQDIVNMPKPGKVAYRLAYSDAPIHLDQRLGIQATNNIVLVSYELMLMAQNLSYESEFTPPQISEGILDIEKANAYWEDSYRRNSKITAGAAFCRSNLNKLWAEFYFQGFEVFAKERKVVDLKWVKDNKGLIVHQLMMIHQKGNIIVSPEIKNVLEGDLRFVLAHEFMHDEFDQFIKGKNDIQLKEIFRNLIEHLKRDRQGSPAGEDYFSQIGYTGLAREPVGIPHVNEAITQMLFTVSIDSKGNMLSQKDNPLSEHALPADIVEAKQKEREALLRGEPYLKPLYLRALSRANEVVEQVKKAMTSSDEAMGVANPGFVGGDRQFWLRYPQQMVSRLVNDYKGKSEPITIVDIGSARGQITKWTAEQDPRFKVLGIESNKELIAQAEQDAHQLTVDERVGFKQEDIAKGIPFADHSVDGIIIHRFMGGVLLDRSARLNLIKEASRVLKEGGYISLVEDMLVEPEDPEGQWYAARYQLHKAILPALITAGVVDSSFKKLLENTDNHLLMSLRDSNGKYIDELKFVGNENGLVTEIIKGNIKIRGINVNQSKQSILLDFKQNGFAALDQWNIVMPPVEGEERGGHNSLMKGIVFKKDYAMTTKTPGGIDLNPSNLDLQIKRDVNGILLPLSQQPLENMRINGLTPVIGTITPVINLPELLGINS